MVRVPKRGRVIVFYIALFLAVSFFPNSSCAQSSNEFQAHIWVDSSSYSEGDSLTIRFTISTTSPPSSYSSIASVSIIDYYPNADSEYLVQNRSCTIGAICYYEDTVDCFGGEGTQTLELIAEIYTITQTVVVKSTCSFYVHCNRDNIPPDISRVELVQPINTTLLTGNPTFTWRIPLTDYDDIYSWTLEYARDIQFQQNRVTISELTSLATIISNNYASISYTVPVSQALTNGTWYWHLSATDAIGNQSAYTAEKRFDINVEIHQVKVLLVSPPNGFTDTPSQPTFSWLPAQGATLYQLQVDNSNIFSSPEIDEDSITTTSFMAPSELEPGKYYWRVNSNAINAQWSDTWSFTIPEKVPNQVVLLSPSNGAQDMPPTLIFQWQTLEGATSYTLEVSTNTQFTRLVVEKTGLTKTSWGTASDWETNDPSQLDKGIYYWRVSSNRENSTSAVWSFTVEESSEEKGAVIHGYVYYDNTGNPASNVTVHIYETQTHLQVTSDITDTTGYFIVDDVQDNKTYYIIIEGYEDQKKLGIIPVDVPTSSNALTLVIKTEGEIIGVVQGEEGAPLPGAKVTLRDSQDQFVNSTSSNNIGSFTFKVTPGKYYVEVTLFGFDDYKGSVFTVEYKEIKDLGLITLTSMWGELVITVQNIDGDLLDATITVKDAAGNIIDTISVTGGTASEEVVVGMYTLDAYADGYQSQAVDNISVESGSTVVQDFILSFAPGSLQIYIEDSEGMSISDAEVFLDGVCKGTTDLTGWLTISDVSPEDHIIHVVREGFTDYTHMYTVDPGETLPLEITMERTSMMWLYILLILIVGAGITVFVFKYANSISSIILKKKISSPLFCPYCGNRIRKEWKTCLYCGENLEKTRIYDDDTQIY